MKTILYTLLVIDIKSKYSSHLTIYTAAGSLGFFLIDCFFMKSFVLSFIF